MSTLTTTATDISEGVSAMDSRSGYLTQTTVVFMDDDIKTRVIILEMTQKDLLETREKHDGLLKQLLVQDQQLVTALESISSKFDRLISNISTGFKVMIICTTVFTTLIGGYWAYSHDLEQKYEMRHD